MFFWESEGGGGERPTFMDTKRVKDLNKILLISEWDLTPLPHEHQSDALPTELSGVL